MDTTKHTPGPWRIKYNGTYGPFIESCDSQDMEYGTAAHHHAKETHSIATAHGNNADNNARLIAAAPETAAERDRLKEANAELLAALKEIVRLIRANHLMIDTLYVLHDADTAIANAAKRNAPTSNQGESSQLNEQSKDKE